MGIIIKGKKNRRIAFVALIAITIIRFQGGFLNARIMVRNVRFWG